MNQEQREHAARQLLGLYNTPKPLQARNRPYDPFSIDNQLNFINQYILNRAHAVRETLDETGVVDAAFAAWHRYKSKMRDEL